MVHDTASVGPFKTAGGSGMNEVRWEETVLDILDNLWLQADSPVRKRITAATHKIDQILQVNAVDARESRDADRRIHFEPPLGVVYRMEPDGKTVSVVDVWLIRPRSK